MLDPKVQTPVAATSKAPIVTPVAAKPKATSATAPIIAASTSSTIKAPITVAKTPASGTATVYNNAYWQTKISKLKEKFPQVKNTEINFQDGNFGESVDKIYNTIGKTINKTKVELHSIIENL